MPKGQHRGLLAGPGCPVPTPRVRAWPGVVPPFRIVSPNPRYSFGYLHLQYWRPRNIYCEAARIEDEGIPKNTGDWAKRSEKAAQLRAMLALAESELGIPVLPGDLDADPWALNT